MKILADIHIAPRTVDFLRSLDFEVSRVGDSIQASASDQEIVAQALQGGYVILTQDLDFSDLIALSGRSHPSLISLRLSTARIENVNEALARVLRAMAPQLRNGAIVVVRDHGWRVRRLPIDHPDE